MIDSILYKLERTIKYLKNLMEKRMSAPEAHKTTLTKREQCVNLIKKMARQMNFPGNVIAELEALDLSIATDEQVDLIHDHLTKLINEVDAERKRTGVDIFKQVEALNN